MRVLLAAFCLFVFGVTWAVMTLPIAVMCNFNPSVYGWDRLLLGFQTSVGADLIGSATVLCTLSALSQYGFRHFIRRIIEEDDPNPPGGFRWVRALQSVLIAWVLWYVTLISHCLK